MQISKKDWNKYIEMLAQLNDTAGQMMRDYVAKNGFGDTEAIVDYGYGLVTKYGEGSAALAAEMYDETARLSGKVLPPAEVAETADYGEVARAINGTIKQSVNPNSCGNTVSRLVKRAGADTTLRNAMRDGAQFAWIPSGDTCAFCLTLASNGFQYMSKSAMKNGHAEHIHANCDCTYAVSFDGSNTVAGYNPDTYKEMYDDAEGKSSKDKINFLRRMQYQDPKVRDKINAQKRAAYAEKRSLLLAAQTEGEATIPKNLIGNFDDFDPLSISEKEREALKGLHQRSLDNRFEYGKIIYDEGETDYLTSELFDKVALPVEQTNGTGLKVLHSHTNDTPPSSADFKPLTIDKVEQIEVATNNGDVWVVKVGDGYRPDSKELEERLIELRKEITLEIQDWPEFSEWTPEERNYMVVREKMFRIARENEWTVMGGRLDG